jgi:tRNA(Ile)-lysidine synthase
MVESGDHILVALSGGPDSVAMLAALVELATSLKITVRAAHLNHELRAAESFRDQLSAEAVAARLGIACAVESVTTLVPGSNLEARARAARYAFLSRVARTHGCTRIATGHTLDDQAETVLIRLLRGTGWDGLAGIRPIRDGRIIRPLLDCSRQQVMAYLRARDLPFCEDSSNQDRRFLRNRVRHDVLPLLRGMNPNIAGHLASTAAAIAAETSLLEQQSAAILAAMQHPALDLAALLRAPAALQPRIVRTWLRMQRGDLEGVTAAHVRAVIELARGPRPNGRCRLPGAELVMREYGVMHWSRDGGPVFEIAPSPVRILHPGAPVVLDSGWQLSAELVAGDAPYWPRPSDLWGMIADAQALQGPLTVRTARPGDRMRPLGVNGRRKLQDLFVDRKLPVRRRWSCPVLECDGEILWVPGVARSANALVTSATQSALSVRAQRTGTGIAGA